MEKLTLLILFVFVGSFAQPALAHDEPLKSGITAVGGVALGAKIIASSGNTGAAVYLGTGSLRTGIVATASQIGVGTMVIGASVYYGIKGIFGGGSNNGSGSGNCIFGHYSCYGCA